MGDQTTCIDELLPFEIPNSWAWSRGVNCLLPMESKKPQGGMFRYIDIDAINNKNQSVREPKELETSMAPSRASRKLHNGDTVFSMVRPYLKNIAYIDETLSDCIASTGFYVCSPNQTLFSKFLYLILISPYTINTVMEYMKGDNSPSIRTEHIENLLIPIPPIQEQKKIVECYFFLQNLLKDGD